MVKRRGYRIELGEIERALYLHPRVREAAVISAADQDGGVTIVACLSCHDGQHPSIIEMKTFCASHLPAYMSPDRFVFLERLPRTSTDKVDYQTLRQESCRLSAAPAASGRRSAARQAAEAVDSGSWRACWRRSSVLTGLIYHFGAGEQGVPVSRGADRPGVCGPLLPAASLSAAVLSGAVPRRDRVSARPRPGGLADRARPGS